MPTIKNASSVSLVLLMYALIVSRTDQIDLKKCLKFKHSTAAPEVLSNFKLVLCASKETSFCQTQFL
jgi:hypothetical protein